MPCSFFSPGPLKLSFIPFQSAAMPLTFYTYAALTAATDNWAEGGRLGRGGFGEVRGVTLRKRQVGKLTFFIPSAAQGRQQTFGLKPV